LRVAPNAPEGLILFAFRPLSGKQNKDKLCAFCGFAVNYYDCGDVRNIEKGVLIIQCNSVKIRGEKL
jgi:hypothetical protein